MYCVYGNSSWYINGGSLFGGGPLLGGPLSEVPLYWLGILQYLITLKFCTTIRLMIIQHDAYSKRSSIYNNTSVYDSVLKCQALTWRIKGNSMGHCKAMFTYELTYCFLYVQLCPSFSQ